MLGNTVLNQNQLSLSSRLAIIGYLENTIKKVLAISLTNLQVQVKIPN